MSERLAGQPRSHRPVSPEPSSHRQPSSKTLSQFPAARLASPPERTLDGGWLAPAPSSSRVPVLGPKSSLLSKTLWSHFVRALCHANPIGEARGAACAVWALAETLRDLPNSERSAGAIALAEVNTRGEVTLGGGTRHVNARLIAEPELVSELVSWLRAAAKGVEDPLGEEEFAPASHASSAHLEASSLDWSTQLVEGLERHPFETLDDLCNWLEENLGVLREHQAEQIGRWARQHRRLAQSREGRLVEELGVALKRLSLGPQASSPSRFGIKIWLASLALLLTTVGVVSRLLLR